MVGPGCGAAEPYSEASPERSRRAPAAPEPSGASRTSPRTEPGLGAGRGRAAGRRGSHVRPGPCVQRPHMGFHRRVWGFPRKRGRAGLLNLEDLYDLAAVASVEAVEFTTWTLPPPPQIREVMGRHSRSYTYAD